MVATFTWMSLRTTNSGFFTFLQSAPEFPKIRGWLQTLGATRCLDHWDEILKIIDRAAGDTIWEKLENFEDLPESEQDEVEWQADEIVMHEDLTRLLADHARKNRDQFR